MAYREQAARAQRLIAEAATQQGLAAGHLTLHADRGPSMTSKPVALRLADRGSTTTHSRPHVSNDHPSSEAQCTTLKDRPDVPARCRSLEEARAFCRDVFPWYHEVPRHSALGWLTPAAVHDGQAAAHDAARQQVLQAAYAAHPERFLRRVPEPPPLPTAAWITPPKPTAAAAAATTTKAEEVSH